MSITITTDSAYVITAIPPTEGARPSQPLTIDPTPRVTPAGSTR